MRYGIWAPIPMWVGNTRKWSLGRNGRRITAVVIHRMEGTLDGSDSYLRREFADYYPYPRLNASTHFGVGAWGWLNRSLRRYQIRQWVDTTNSAFGWAARPTDTPTTVAKNTLGGDLGNPYADLNWQVIAVEIEGFASQPWAPGLNTKVKELLDAIARAHGPLVVMAHTDCSSKPCPGMATFLAAMPGYYGQRLSTGLPDTSVPKKEGLPVRYERIRKTGTVIKGSKLRTAPRLDAPIRRTLTADVRRFIDGAVPGDPWEGSNKWYVWWVPRPSDDKYDGEWLHVHKSGVKL